MNSMRGRQQMRREGREQGLILIKACNTHTHTDTSRESLFSKTNMPKK